MISFCVAAFMLANGNVAKFTIPNCDPAKVKQAVCLFEGEPYARSMQIACYDPATKKLVYTGRAYPSKET